MSPVFLQAGTQYKCNPCETVADPLEASTKCQVCELPAYDFTPLSPPSLVYLCRHTVHATCALPHPDIDLPPRLDNPGVTHLLSGDGAARRSGKSLNRALGGKLGYAAALRVRVGGCPLCVKEGLREKEGRRTVCSV